MQKGEGPRRRLGVLALVSLLCVAALPVGIVVAEPAGESGRVEATLEQLSGLLMRLEAELAALERPQAERLEQQLEEVIEAIEGLLDELDGPRRTADLEAWKARLLRFDLQLHRLVYSLEEIVESTAAVPARPDAEESIDNLRIILDSIVMDASFGMDGEQFDQLEEAVYKTARVLGGRIKDLAKRVEPRTALPELARLVERLEELLVRLDGLLLHRAPQRR
jgi:hypothetical protein